MSAALPSGSTRGRFSVMPPPVMCAIPFTRPASSNGRTACRYDRCGASSASPDGHAKLRHEGIRRHPGDVEEHAAGERIAVGVKSRRRQADQDVARLDRPAVDDLRPFDDADNEAGDVVFAGGVEARHLGGLAADQRAAVFAATSRHAGDDLLGDRPATDGRSPDSRGRRAVRRPGPGCR